MSNPYRVYFDVCCLNRPFDDSSQDRIRLEAEAVLSIYRKCRLGEWTLLTSEVIESELRQTPDTQRVELIMAALAIATEKAQLDSALKQRAGELVTLGLKPFDAAHIASAEAIAADLFLTTDDRLIRKATRYQTSLNVLVSNPVTWLLNLTPYEGDNTDDDAPRT
jgi:predicted nucleic acid-binding protein